MVPCTKQEAYIAIGRILPTYIVGENRRFRYIGSAIRDSMKRIENYLTYDGDMIVAVTYNARIQKRGVLTNRIMEILEVSGPLRVRELIERLSDYPNPMSIAARCRDLVCRGRLARFGVAVYGICNKDAGNS
jgi:hypothetical protein